jgi:hypothetical protein
MGVLIVVAMIAMGYGIYRKAADPSFSFIPGEPAEAPAAAVKPFGDLTVSIPPGCTIAGMVAEGNRLYLRLGPDGACTRVIAVDVATGTVIGTVTVAP